MGFIRPMPGPRVRQRKNVEDTLDRFSFGYYPNIMRSVFIQDPTTGDRAGMIRRLAEAMEEVRSRGCFGGFGVFGVDGVDGRAGGVGHDRPGERVSTGWGAVDAELAGGDWVGRAAGPGVGGLQRGAVHEWFGVNGEVRGDRWVPALGVMVHLARRIVRTGQGGPRRVRAGGLVVWVGERSWVYPWSVGADAVGRAVLARSVFVAARTRDERVWAVEVALRSVAAGVVIADGSGLRMPDSRRLQLAAGSGMGLGLLVRPAWERGELSAAQTRWLVRPALVGGRGVASRAAGVEAGGGMRLAGREEEGEAGVAWMVELLRCKGMRPGVEGVRRWIVRRDHADGEPKGDVDLVADAAGGCGEAEGGRGVRRA